MKKDDIFIASTGEYDGYMALGVFKALRDFSPDDIPRDELKIKNIDSVLLRHKFAQLVSTKELWADSFGGDIKE